MIDYLLLQESNRAIYIYIKLKFFKIFKLWELWGDEKGRNFKKMNLDDFFLNHKLANLKKKIRITLTERSFKIN